jgi:hypothetical protein
VESWVTLSCKITMKGECWFNFLQALQFVSVHPQPLLFWSPLRDGTLKVSLQVLRNQIPCTTDEVLSNVCPWYWSHFEAAEEKLHLVIAWRDGIVNISSIWTRVKIEDLSGIAIEFPSKVERNSHKSERERSRRRTSRRWEEH